MARTRSSRGGDGRGPRMDSLSLLRLVTASLVVILWTAFYVRTLLTDVTPPAELSAVMLLVAGYLFGTEALKRRR